MYITFAVSFSHTISYTPINIKHIKFIGKHKYGSGALFLGSLATLSLFEKKGYLNKLLKRHKLAKIKASKKASEEAEEKLKKEFIEKMKRIQKEPNIKIGSMKNFKKRYGI